MVFSKVGADDFAEATIDSITAVDSALSALASVNRSDGVALKDTGCCGETRKEG